MLTAIWASDQNHLIGNKDQMPWHLPNDFQFFKSQTMGKILVMGRRTFAGMGYKPLPGRQIIILSHIPDLPIPGPFAEKVQVVTNKNFILDLGKKQDIIIAGGKQVYETFWPYIDELRITEISDSFLGDVYFNPDLNDFSCYASVQGIKNKENPFKHTFNFYRRNQHES